MNNFLKKITSRKFIVTVIVMITGIATAFKESDDTTLKAIGCISAGVAAIAYMIVEGNLDAASIKKAVEEILSGMPKKESKKELKEGKTNEENK